jgi:Flp pilus assembly protein TadD
MRRPQRSSRSSDLSACNRSARAYQELILRLGELGRTDEAIAWSDTALCYCPRTWELYNSRGNILVRAGKAGAAIPFYRRGVALSGGSPEIWSNLAAAHEACGQSDKARACLRRALQGGTGDPKVLVARPLN